MSEMEQSIERIMAAPVAGLMKLSDHDFDFVLALVYAARQFCQPVEIKPVEIKPVEIKRARKVKHGQKH